MCSVICQFFSWGAYTTCERSAVLVHKGTDPYSFGDYIHVIVKYLTHAL